MKILLANIGNRNIKYNDNFIDKTDKGFFEFTKMIWDDINNEQNNVKINILNNILDQNNIDKVYLFVTNQSPNFHQDTYYEGKIIQYLLKDKYKTEIIEKKDDPRNRENAFKFFENFFDENKYFKDHELIISGSGGIPAMKEAINFYSVLKFDNSTILDVDENTGEIFTSNIQHEYLKNFEKLILREMIKKHDYNGAYNFLYFSRLKSPYLSNFLLFLLHRYNFNFEKANEFGKQLNLDIFENIPNKEPKNISDLIEYKKTMILELFDNLEITYQKGEYTMILGKTFALKDNLIVFLFETEFKINTKKDFDKISSMGIPIKETRKLEKYVETFELENKIHEHYQKGSQDFKELKKFSDVLQSMKLIRNNSIVAHGFGGARKNDVDTIIQAINIFKKDYFGIEENIFEKLEKILLNKII